MTFYFSKVSAVFRANALIPQPSALLKRLGTIDFVSPSLSYFHVTIDASF